MSGVKKLSELVQMTKSDLTDNDVILINDLDGGRTSTKVLKFSTLVEKLTDIFDARYTPIAESQSIEDQLPEQENNQEDNQSNENQPPEQNNQETQEINS